MQILIFIIAFFIFLHALYRLVKDDHVFLRKNIKMEEFFDIAFIVVTIGLIFTQIVPSENNSFITFFVLACSISLFFIGKYRKFPLGRFFDFFTISFLAALPFVFLAKGFFLTKVELVLYLISAVIYFVLWIFFRRVLLRKIMNRSLKEGRLSIFFLAFFSFFSLVMSTVRTFLIHIGFLSLENIILIFLLIIGLILLLIQNKD